MTKKRGRPSQNKLIGHYTLDKEVIEFINSLPDGDRSKFVNTILKEGIQKNKEKRDESTANKND